MIKLSKRATIYLEPDLHKILKFKAAETSRSVSDLVNEAVRHELAEDLEDLDDLKSVKKREKDESIPFEEVLRKLKADGKI